MYCHHTAADAYFRGYDLVAVEDGCEAFSEEAHQDGLDYLEEVYGAEILPTEPIIDRWEGAAVAA